MARLLILSGHKYAQKSILCLLFTMFSLCMFSLFSLLFLFSLSQFFPLSSLYSPSSPCSVLQVLSLFFKFTPFSMFSLFSHFSVLRSPSFLCYLILHSFSPLHHTVLPVCCYTFALPCSSLTSFYLLAMTVIIAIKSIHACVTMQACTTCAMRNLFTLLQSDKDFTVQCILNSSKKKHSSELFYLVHAFWELEWKCPDLDCLSQTAGCKVFIAIFSKLLSHQDLIWDNTSLLTITHSELYFPNILVAILQPSSMAYWTEKLWIG